MFLFYLLYLHVIYKLHVFSLFILYLYKMGKKHDFPFLTFKLFYRTSLALHTQLNTQSSGLL